MHELLENRTKSGFPVSIGTGLALETIFDPVIEVYDKDRVVPEKVDLSNYDTIAINVFTLLRNIINSMPKDAYLIVPRKDLPQALLDEVEYLFNLFSSFNYSCIFYINTYREVLKKYPQEYFRQATTSKQLILDDINKECLESLLLVDEIETFSSYLEFKNTTKVLVLTHTPWDLLSYKKYREFDLLESHTGVVKTPINFNSKYYKIPGKDMSFLPFNETLLAGVFGDNIMFHPKELKYRTLVYDKLLSSNVNPKTSEEIVKILLSKIPKSS